MPLNYKRCPVESAFSLDGVTCNEPNLRYNLTFGRFRVPKQQLQFEGIFTVVNYT